MKQLSLVREKQNKLVFVIHKHHATSLHYDLRLQVGSVMPSWAIPKGPTLDPTHKRLAMLTTDHAVDYRHYEGVIPEGEVGAGPVMIWDEGTYQPEIELPDKTREVIEGKVQGDQVMKSGLKKGEVKFTLHGKKLRGSFALVKMKRFGQNAWLLIKHKDEFVKKGYDANDYDFSAVSKRSLQQIVKTQSKSND